MTDPFAAPAAIPSSFPTVASLRGRLVLITPVKQETVPNNLGAPGQMQERVTANVIVVDGLGPVPVMKNNAQVVIQGQAQWLDGPEFTGMWLQSEVVVVQLADALKNRGTVLARVDTKTPGMQPGKGNPWGLIDPTEEDKNIARNFLANRVVGAATAPAAQAAPVYVQQTPQQAVPQTPAAVAAPYAVATPAPAPQQAVPQVQATASAPVSATAPQPGTNPFA